MVIVSNDMLDSFLCPSPNTLLLIYLTIGFFANGAPRALVGETKSNQPQGREATLLKVLHSCLTSRYRREGRRVRLIKPPLLNPCHIICQLGSALDNVDSVKAVFLEPTFGRS